ncbi:hypothetical protein RhiirA5_425607 [Rhizophagus irregularis]|uniref:Uncharacterized protein n=1 Tax=Rhizophagus irregularis TaxID=588596 RepID=A0A2I1ED74_9GLOM|nr:hypothetical protein RhiirA5_425607 [Rhizophagus irregularis]PKC66897.1 hypothetical protein RhiirA1_459127 [Rhizophagus irregularis]PKY20085.1 hypothetical protein RhiirB3_433297 [Rhizophagus irregularis]
MPRRIQAKKQKPISTTIQNHDLQDVHECLAGKDILDTWKSGETSSRIDYIFASEGILGKIISHEILEIEDFKTDHKALTIKFEIKEKLGLNRNEFFKKTKAEPKNVKLESEDWKIIAERVDDRLLEINEQHIDREEMWTIIIRIHDEERKNVLVK